MTLHDPLAQAASDIHRAADAMLGYALMAVVLAALTGLAVQWLWWFLAAAGAVGTAVMFLCFLDARAGRGRASQRREMILGQTVLAASRRRPERPHGFVPPREERTGEAMAVPLRKASA